MPMLNTETELVVRKMRFFSSRRLSIGARLRSSVTTRAASAASPPRPVPRMTGSVQPRTDDSLTAYRNSATPAGQQEAAQVEGPRHRLPVLAEEQQPDGQRHQPERDVDEEAPAPGQLGDQDAPEHRAGGQPEADPQRHHARRRARRSAGNARKSIAWPTGTMSPPPIPWMTRKTISSRSPWTARTGPTRR